MEQRGLEVILESMESKLSIVAEGHSVLNNKLDKVVSDLKETNEKMDYNTNMLIARIDNF